MTTTFDETFETITLIDAFGPHFEIDDTSMSLQVIVNKITILVLMNKVWTKYRKLQILAKVKMITLYKKLRMIYGFTQKQQGIIVSHTF
mgnify:CR=1 FL=1